ncbi:hypothetical protein NIES4103_29120 [Nostoc sp. NIES-4103]|nr:hypothetical protein NIES4103_29120 [Nostoc sp. NIES-4103]
MKSQQTKKFTNAPEQGMFGERSLGVQLKKAKKSQRPDLKTSLIQAEQYGHHLNQMQPTNVSTSQPVQLMPANKGNKKKGKESPGQSSSSAAGKQEPLRMQGDHVFNDFIGDIEKKDKLNIPLPWHSGLGIEQDYRNQKVDYSSDGLNNAEEYGNAKRDADIAISNLLTEQKKPNGKTDVVKPGSSKNPLYQEADQALKTMLDQAVDKSAYSQITGSGTNTTQKNIVQNTDKYRQSLAGMTDRMLDQRILTEQYYRDKK